MNPEASKLISDQTAKFQSCWQQGADAARAGKSALYCPYGPSSYNFVTWFNGWTYAMYTCAKEKEQAQQQQIQLADDI